MQQILEICWRIRNLTTEVFPEPKGAQIKQMEGKVTRGASSAISNVHVSKLMVPLN
jgi:hypothetical protein